MNIFVGEDTDATYANNDSGIEADKIFGSAPSPAMSEAGFVGGVNIPSEKLVRYTTAVGSAEKTKSGAAAYKMNDAANGGVSRKPNLMPHSLLSIPPKSTPIENRPLVDIRHESSEEEEEQFNLPLPVVTHSSKRKEYRRVHTKEPSVKELLKQDGFSIHTDSADELDLIPPKPLSSANRCSCFRMCSNIFFPSN